MPCTVVNFTSQPQVPELAMFKRGTRSDWRSNSSSSRISWFCLSVMKDQLKTTPASVRKTVSIALRKSSINKICTSTERQGDMAHTTFAKIYENWWSLQVESLHLQVELISLICTFSLTPCNELSAQTCMRESIQTQTSLSSYKQTWLRKRMHERPVEHKTVHIGHLQMLCSHENEVSKHLPEDTACFPLPKFPWILRLTLVWRLHVNCIREHEQNGEAQLTSNLFSLIQPMQRMQPMQSQESRCGSAWCFWLRMFGGERDLFGEIWFLNVRDVNSFFHSEERASFLTT